jgi:hypothetical protein
MIDSGMSGALSRSFVFFISIGFSVVGVAQSGYDFYEPWKAILLLTFLERKVKDKTLGGRPCRWLFPKTGSRGSLRIQLS